MLEIMVLKNIFTAILKILFLMKLISSKVVNPFHLFDLDWQVALDFVGNDHANFSNLRH